MRSQTIRPGIAGALLFASLVLMLTSMPAAAQTTRPQADKSPDPGNTCVFGEEFVAFCQHEDGGEGYLGFGSTGVHGQHQSGTNGYLGGISYGAYGSHANGHVGSLGGPDYGAYGEHTLGHFGYLGGSLYGVLGAHNNGNFGWLGGSNYGAYGGQVNSGPYGYLGGPDNGAYGENFINGHFGWLGGVNLAVYGEHNNGNHGYLGGANFAVRGQNANGNFGLFGTGEHGVYGFAPVNDHAGYFEGRVHVNGTFSKSGGSFKIDHPLDPEGRYLAHSFVESPDMMNVYNGNVTLDAAGEAVVVLPEYFEALNRDFRYQLTAVGAPGPNLYIAEEIAGNRFKIAGGTPGMKVSWQVTGIRQDRWAEANRIVVEEAKPAVERGYYLHPGLYGQPEERGVEWARDPEGMREIKERPQRMEEERQRMEEERQQIEQERQRLGQRPEQHH